MENNAMNGAAESGSRQFVSFALADEIYGVDIEQVQEIISYQRFNKLPEQPDYMPGVFNLRGAVVPAVDLRRRFGFEEKDYDKNTVILVLNIEDQTVGVVVDAVSDVVTFLAEEMQPPPELSRSEKKRYIMGMGKKKKDELVILLDVEQLLNFEEMKGLAEDA